MKSATLKSLGEVVDKLYKPFCCGRKLHLEGQNIHLHYKSKEAGELREIRLPGAKEEVLAQLSVLALAKVVSKSPIPAYADSIPMR